MKKLAIVITHPIQYYVPVFRLLAEKAEVKVFYTIGGNANNTQFEPGFKREIKWDIPLLDGYLYEFVENTAKHPGSQNFSGIKNPTLNGKIKTFKPDAILIYGWAYQSHLAVIRHFYKKIPLWFRGDSTLLDENSGIKNLLRAISLKWVYRHIDRAFFVGQANKSYFSNFGLKERQLTFAPHAIDNNRFGEDRLIESELLRKELGVTDDSALILFAGKFEKKKNPTLLLQAFLELSPTNAHLLFVGNGEMEQSLKQQANKPADENSAFKKTKIHFMDFQNQSYMPVVYQACDLFCLPSQGPAETWGLAVNEAMAAGKAVLVSDKVGCTKDLISDGENGLIFESGNLTDLKIKLSQMLENLNFLLKMGKKSQLIIKQWNFKNQADTILKDLNATN